MEHRRITHWSASRAKNCPDHKLTQRAEVLFCCDFQRCRRPSVFPSAQHRVQRGYTLRLGSRCLVWLCAAAMVGGIWGRFFTFPKRAEAPGVLGTTLAGMEPVTSPRPEAGMSGGLHKVDGWKVATLSWTHPMGHCTGSHPKLKHHLNPDLGLDLQRRTPRHDLNNLCSNS